MLLHIRDDAVCGLADGVQTGTELRQLGVFRPCCHIAEAVRTGFDAEVGADHIGDAFGLHFFCIAAFDPALRCLLQAVIVELGVGDLMDGGGYRLHLAHALPQRDALEFGAEIAVHIGRQRLELHRHGRGAAQRFHERLIILNAAGQVGDGAGHTLRQRLSVRLGVVEHLYRTEHGDLDLLFLGNHLAVRIQNGQIGVRVELFLLDFLLIRRGRDDGDALLAPQHMAGELVPPAVVARHKCGVRALQVDERLIVEGIVVKPAHGSQVIAVLFHIAGFKDVADTCLDAVGDLLELFSVFTGLL